MNWKALGPGLLFAGASIGVSHLVQSTRAGASYGLGLVVVVVLANLVKYPAFAFGPRYAAVTGCSLLEGYRRQGRWALAIYALATVGTMFTVQAAVTIMTAGLVIALFGLSWSPAVVSALLLFACMLLLGFGRYRWLDRTMKLVVASLTVLTLIATALVLPRLDLSTLVVFPSGVWGDAAAIGFAAALVGWMPSAVDLAVWHSLWTLARRRDTGYAPPVSEAMTDFNIGYIGTAVLAVCFVALGAAVVHGSGRSIPEAPGAFALMVTDMYTAALGDWSRPVFGTAALMVMFSTVLTVVDGFPRGISALLGVFRGPESEGEDLEARQRATYWPVLLVLAAGTMTILVALGSRLLLLVDVATISSFVTAPALAVLNHRAVFTAPEPPGRLMRYSSLAAIAALTLFTLYFLYLRYS